ncbi:hypothetical protein [Agrococcus lahaulensis]|uniref:hypothetical protein n=1 Tax=Agrococcus lahaulensis TaxID=341722 RepID=UPI0012EC6B24|nr:hypothetical protein [Agrococcus lahaulensis]
MTIAVSPDLGGSVDARGESAFYDRIHQGYERLIDALDAVDVLDSPTVGDSLDTDRTQRSHGPVEALAELDCCHRPDRHGREHTRDHFLRELHIVRVIHAGSRTGAAVQPSKAVAMPLCAVTDHEADPTR